MTPEIGQTWINNRSGKVVEILGVRGHWVWVDHNFRKNRVRYDIFQRSYKKHG